MRVPLLLALLATTLTSVALPIDGGSKPKVEVAIAVDGDTPPAKKFAKDVPKLYAFFRSKGTAKGDTFKCVWIAEDVGDAADKNTKIDETTLDAEKADAFGAFSLSRPTNGWPLGKYRVDIYLGDEVATSAKFTIE